MGIGIKKERSVFLLVGLPGSGKSTWAQSYVWRHPTTVIVSRDGVRRMLNGVYSYGVPQRGLITQLVAALVKELFKTNYDIIIDQLNLTKKDRKEVTDFIRNLGGKTTIVFIKFTPDGEENIERLCSRKGDRGLTVEQARIILEYKKESFEPIENVEDFNLLGEYTPLAG